MPRQLTDVNAAAGRPDVRRARAVHLRRLERRDRARLCRQAGRLRRAREEVPGRLPDPRRAAGQLRQQLVHYRWNPQTYAGAGYAVVMIDFHGSTGYGQAFTDAISEHWGDRPLEDLQKGWAAALANATTSSTATAPARSAAPTAATWSTGSPATGRSPWKCLVNHDGVFDTRAMGYATEELWFTEWENGGTPWDNPRGYERFNPVNHVGKWNKPMLVVQGGTDYRIPLDAGPVDLHGPAAPRHREPVPLLPGREPLGAQAAELRAVARDGRGVAGPVDGGVARFPPPQTPSSPQGLSLGPRV